MRRLTGGTIALLAFIPFTIDAAEPEDAFESGATIRDTVALLERCHLSRKRLDDQLSKLWFETFLDRLDPRRTYFLEADIREFREFEHRLDDMAREGDFRFPELVRRRYRTRTAEAASRVAAALASGLGDARVDDGFGVHDAYAATRTELVDRTRSRLRAELSVELRHGRAQHDVERQLTGRFDRIARRAREMNDERLCEVFLDSLASVHDPHTRYLSPTSLERFNQTVTITTFSLGLGLRERSGHFVIKSVLPSMRGSTTDVGLVGWALIGIRRVDGRLLDVVEMYDGDLHELITAASGPLGMETEVVLELFDPVGNRRMTLSWPRFSSR